jgi:3-hydroxymyristoyl/3-hydroxydecanoyl-(acyl carrier protein) dehydratase
MAHPLPTQLLLPNAEEARALIRRAVLQPEPHLFLDRVTAQGSTWIETEWVVPSEPSLFRGDARARILPGTFCCEHVVQSGELLIFALRGETRADEGVPVLTRLRNARFRNMVQAGDVLTTRVGLVDQLGPVFRLEAKTSCQGARVLEVSLDFAATTALSEASPLRADRSA